MTTVQGFTLDQLIEGVGREVNYRIRCYPKWVQQGTLNQRNADYQLALMQAVLENLKGQRKVTGMQGNLL